MLFFEPVTGREGGSAKSATTKADTQTPYRYHARLDHGPPHHFSLQHPPQLPPRAQDLTRRPRRSSRHLHHLLAVLLAAVW